MKELQKQRHDPNKNKWTKKKKKRKKDSEKSKTKSKKPEKKPLKEETAFFCFTTNILIYDFRHAPDKEGTSAKPDLH